MCEELHDPFTDQVECARYRAERDALAQRMEDVASEIDRTLSGVEGIEDAPAMRWARGLREALGALHAQRIGYEDIEAARWVREHGGLSHVKDIYHDLRAVVERLGIEWSESELHVLMDTLDRRLMPEGYEWLRYESGEPLRYEDRYVYDGREREVWHIDFDSYGKPTILNKDGTRFHPDKGERVNRPAPKALDADGAEIYKGRIAYGTRGRKYRVTELCEYEPSIVHAQAIDDGELGDEFIAANTGLNSYQLDASKLTHRAPVIAADGRPLREGETVWSVDSGTRYTVEKVTDELIPIKCCSEMGSTVSLHPSQLTHERVRRSAVSAADGDGCCEPGTYRCQEVAFTCDSCGHTVFVDKCMVDEIRYLRAKGIRTLNCCCGHGGKVEPFIIVNEDDERRMLDMGYERRVNEHGVTYFTPKSACPPKALAADGRPLREGEAVWEVVTGDGYVVERIYSGTTEPDFPGHTVACRRPDDIVTHMFKPSQLTHERPVADTWERLEDDAGKNPFDYCKDVGHRLDTCENSEAYKTRDLVRRAKKLLERGQ